MMSLTFLYFRITLEIMMEINVYFFDYDLQGKIPSATNAHVL